MLDIITIGSAMKDVFLKCSHVKVLRTCRAVTGKGVLLDTGSKVEVDEIILETGGGGTNTAVSFSNLGLKTGFFGKVGADSAGRHILDVLREHRVDTSLVLKDRKHITGYSTVISPKEGERVALVYRGANNFIRPEEVAVSRLNAKWIYISPLSGTSMAIIPKITRYCEKRKIRVAMNPSSRYINRGIPDSVLRELDVLFLNREEASRLTGANYKNESEIIKKLMKLTKAVVVMTQGKKGAVVCDRIHVYRANAPSVKVVNTLGAGDAFCSGFTYGLIKSNNIEHAMKIGTLNASLVVQGLGAKKGLLKIRNLNKHRQLMNRIKVRRVEGSI